MKRVASYAVAVLLTMALVPIATAGPAGAVPGEPTLTAPSDGASVTSNPVLAWDAVAGATSYRVQVSVDSDFSPLTVNVTTPNTKYGHVADLPLGVLYWRVAAIDASGQGDFSTERTFDKDPLSGPVLSSPADGTVLDFPADPPVLSWQPFAGADHYEVQIDTEETFTAPVTNVNTANPAYTLTATPTIDQAFFWRVRAISAGSVASDYSETRSYSFDWPDVPVLQLPPNDDDLSDAIEEIVFQWTPASGAVSYDIQVSPNDQFTDLVVNVTSIRSTRYSPPTTLLNGAYFWRVRARNYGSSVGAWSDTSTFLRGWPAPDTVPNHRVDLVSPADGDLQVGLPEFSWTPVRLAAEYDLEIGDDPNFSPGSFETCTTEHTTFIPLAGNCDPAPGATMYWRVKPVDRPRDVQGLYSEVFSLVYDPGIPALLSPANGASGLVAPVLLTWAPANNDNGAPVSSYRVRIYNGVGAQVETALTLSTSYVPQGLDPVDGPFSWKVQVVTDSGEGIIPGASRSFSFANPTSFSAAPDPITPDGTSDFHMPYLEWEPVSGATSYEIWRATAPSSVYSLFKDGLSVPGYKHTGSHVTGNYTYFIRAKDGATILAEGDVGSYTVASFGNAVLTAPDHCAAAAVCATESATPTFQWTWNPMATHYRIYLASDPNFTNIVPGYNGVKVHYPRYRPVKNLPDVQAGQATYWYARPCYGDSPEVCGAGPTTFAGANPPVRAFAKRSNPIVLSSPANGATAGNQIVFDWADYLATNLAAGDPADLEARNYKIDISTTADMQSIIHTKTVDQTVYTVFDETLPDGPLYWRVQAIDESDNLLSFSPVRLITKTSPLVSLLTPASGATVSSVPLFTWAAQDYAGRYTIEVYENVDQPLSSGNRVYNATTPMTGSIPTGALPAGTYGWRMRRLDGGGLPGPWTANDNNQLRLFTVAGPVVSLLTPANGGNFTDNNLSFTWTAAPGAAQYRFQADNNPDFSSPFESATTVMTSWHSTKVYPNGSYSWRVQTIDGEGNVVATSAVRTFTRGTAPPTATYYHALTPARILDSRDGTGGFNTKWGAGASRNVDVTGDGGVPTDALAVALNVTVTGTTADGYLTVFPAGQPAPNTSTLNWKSGKSIANAATVTVGAGDDVTVKNATGSTHVIFDVVGYYDTNSGTGGGLTPLVPDRLLDTRDPGEDSIGPGDVQDLVVSGGASGVPANVDAVVLNVTATGPTAGSFLTVWPAGTAQPTASSVNFSAGQTIPNAVTAAVGSGGQISIFNNTGSVDVIVDVVGYFDQGSGSPYRALPNPVRFQDSRPAFQVGPFNTKWGAGTVRDITVTGATTAIPTTAVAALLNVTVANTTGSSSFLTVWPDGASQPTASSLNWTGGVFIANSVTTKLGGPAAANLGKISARNQSGTTDVLMDAYGYFG